MRRALALFLDRPDRPASGVAKALTIAFLLGLLTLVCWSVLSVSYRGEVFWKYRDAFLRGWLLTIGLSACALVVSTLLGLAAALGRRSSFLPLRYLAVGYVELVRGLPFLVLILFLFYAVPLITQIGDRFTFGVVALSLFAGAYIAEIIRSGIESISQAQWESARAIGLTPVQTYRYVVFPQALRQIIPPLTGQFASLIKDSSLLSVIGLAEFTLSAQQIFSATYSGIESYLPLGLGYLVLTLTVSFAARTLERKLV